ncbi:MAG: hypothetical protein U1F00_10875 [Rhodoferax sp.]
MRALLACENPAKGMGVVNWAKYCNPKLDEPRSTTWIRGRDRICAAGIIGNDVALILHFQVSASAVKKGLIYQGRGDERTTRSTSSPADPVAGHRPGAPLRAGCSPRWACPSAVLP